MSNVTGENLDLLKMFMNLLSSRSPNTDDQPPEFQIDDTYSVPGISYASNVNNCSKLNRHVLEFLHDYHN